jgi:hypothetical protein
MPIAPLLARMGSEDKAKVKARAPAVQIPETTKAADPAAAASDADGRTPVTPVDAQKAALFKIRNPVNDPRVSAPVSLDGEDVSAPVTPVDSDKPAPFKIRNPVYDARAAPTPPAEESVSEVDAGSERQAATPSPDQNVLQKPGEPTEATKAAPFKLRHTVYDPSAAFGTTPTKAGEEDLPASAPPVPVAARSKRDPSPASAVLATARLKGSRIER